MYYGANKEYYFYLSGLLSFAFFLILLIIGTYFVVFQTKPKTFALTKDTYIAVSIDITPKAKTKNNAKPKEKPAPKPATTPEVVEETPDISDLFSNVSSQKIKTKPKVVDKPIDRKLLAAIEKRTKSAKKKTTDDAKKKISELDLVKPSIEVSGASSSSGAEVNEYYAKIQALIYDNFYPPVSTEGSVAEVKIWLSESGRITDFRILKPSGSPLFNQEVERLSSRLKAVSFPKSPEGRAETLSIILTVQE